MNGPFSLDPAFCGWLTLAMVHFLWQGLVVTALACAAARWLREASPRSRHRVYAASLALMLACFPATLGLLYLSDGAVPAVVGVLRPAILLPVTLATGLAPGQIELVIAHEMAHIRRWDHLMMLAQRIAESVLFFHPAVWYLSHRLSIERELCCDSLVITAGARPSDYAETLLRVVESSRRPERGLPAASLAMTPGRGRSAALVHRLMCILGQRSGSPMRLGRWWSIGLASTIVLTTALGVRLCVRAESAKASAEDARLVRLITSHELTKVHWMSLEGQENFRPTIDALYNDLLAESAIGVSWTARFLRVVRAKKPPLTLTDFEKEALARIDQGAAEVFRRSDTGVVRYVRPIRARRTCVTLCHPPRQPFTPGDLLGVISVEVVPKQETTP